MNYKCIPGDQLCLHIEIHLNITNYIDFTSEEIKKVISDYLNNKMHSKPKNNQ